MKTKSFFTTAIIVAVFAIIFYNCGGGGSGKSEEKTKANVSEVKASMLPQDVANTCTVSNETFAGWFEDGKITENGRVKPANSALFTPDEKNPNCSFYLWSEQMFLWLASPDGNRPVFASTLFWTVSSETNGTRTLIPHESGKPLKAIADIKKVNTEEGQATNNVLLDRNGNVVYYITMVNDVYKALLEKTQKDSTSVTQFPTNINEVKGLGTFPDAIALAMELKTSWVEVEKLQNPETYITVNAIIPTYDKSNKDKWVLKEETTTTTLALVGMHIVGSAKGHPEMIWSTFEHKSNTPNAEYTYRDSTNKKQPKKADAEGYWLFNQKPENMEKQNQNFAKFSSTDNAIEAVAGFHIQPSDTRRIFAWGSSEGVKPNPFDSTTADANTKVISINNSVMNQLVGNDIRKNYVFIGSTWTNGTTPNGTRYDPKIKSIDGLSLGTSSLANSTMETNFQASPQSCFTCHSGTLDPKVFVELGPGLSHIFRPLWKGLPPSAVTTKK